MNADYYLENKQLLDTVIAEWKHVSQFIENVISSMRRSTDAVIR